MVGEGDCIAIFHSVSRVMKAEKILKGQQLDVLLIPVPRLLSADCGMAIRYSYLIHSGVLHALTEANVQVVDVWLKRDGEYRRLV